MIPTMLSKSRHAAVLLSGGIDSLLVLQQVREHAPDIDVVVFRADMTKEQWKIIDNLIRLFDLTVVTLPPRASYLVPNGDQLARVDEYDLGGAVVPHLRDFVHDDARCALEAEQKFLPSSPLDYDLVFVGTRATDHSEATGQPIRRAITKVDGLTIVAPVYYWTDDQVKKAAQGLPYSKEWYEDGDDRFDTGNIVACSRCLRHGTREAVLCPKLAAEISGHEWDQQAILTAFRQKFGFEVK